MHIVIKISIEVWYIRIKNDTENCSIFLHHIVGPRLFQVSKFLLDCEGKKNRFSQTISYNEMSISLQFLCSNSNPYI